MKPFRKRKLVDAVYGQWDVSIRRACRLLEMDTLTVMEAWAGELNKELNKQNPEEGSWNPITLPYLTVAALLQDMCPLVDEIRGFQRTLNAKQRPRRS